MTSATAPITYAPAMLWAAARLLITTIFSLFGDPAQIATQHTHRKDERALLLKWLRAGEALLRHLLLIEAAHYPRPNTRPLLHANKLSGRARVRRLMSFFPDKPDDWRVSFRCLAPMDRRLPAGKVAQTASSAQNETKRRLEAGGPSERTHVAPKFSSAWPLAERAEALLRAFNNPESYAKRLARRLHATPHRAAELTRHPPICRT